MSQITDKALCRRLDEMLPLAYWSMNGGVEVKEIEYGIEDYILCVTNAWYSPHCFHRARINYSKDGREYIKIFNTRYYLDEAIRC